MDTQLELKFEEIAERLSPDGPIRSQEHLRGRGPELDRLLEQLRYSRTVPFIFGDRGVGKTSLARTSAQLVTKSDREHVYVACAPGARMLTIFREVAHDLIAIAAQVGSIPEIKKKIELNLSANPGIKLTLERRKPLLEQFEDVNHAVRTLRDIDKLVADNKKTVVVLDELEELDDADRAQLAFLVKQVGDQEFGIKLVLVGIAENVHELIGAHASIPRYIHEVALQPLKPQDLMDIVADAGNAIGVQISQEILYRIAIIGNGYPHFAHLVGKFLLQEAVRATDVTISDKAYRAGIAGAVAGSHEELRTAYETATQRRDDVYKHLLWALADIDTVDIRIDEWVAHYFELAKKLLWQITSEEDARSRIQRLGQDNYGAIVVNPSIRYGGSETRYRYKRFASTLMRSHIRLVAANEGVLLGSKAGL